MAISYRNLDNITRELMISELELDGRDGIYISSYLNESGREEIYDLMSESFLSGTDDTLSRSIITRNLLNSYTTRRNRNGTTTQARVPFTAATTLAEGQFNLYYMRALSIRALSENRRIIVYRGKDVENPRAESQMLIGENLDPNHVLTVLRETLGVNPSIGIPLPNSGLSLQLI
jgi:hypothetical protein